MITGVDFGDSVFPGKLFFVLICAPIRMINSYSYKNRALRRDAIINEFLS